MPNLFIVDGSIFVTSAAVNPTTTIQALALRTADYIKQARDGRTSRPYQEPRREGEAVVALAHRETA